MSNEIAKYFATIDGNVVELEGVTFLASEVLAERSNVRSSDSMKRVAYEGKVAVGTNPGVPGLIEADRCIGYSRTPSKHKCDARCMNAKGNQCECSCGGANHGKGGAPAWDFSDLENWDDAELTPVADQALIAPAAQLGMGKADSKATIARFRCNNCGGTGRWKPTPWSMRSWPCRICKGKGLLKTDPQKRILAKQRAQQERVDARQAYREAHAAVFAWLDANRGKSDFARSLLSKFEQYGNLTPGQLAAVESGLARDAARKAEQAAKPADAQIAGEGFKRMIAAFAAARASGLKYPKFQVADYVFSPAGDKAAAHNMGCVFVKGGRSFSSAYLGKINPAGGFFKGRDCTATDEAAIAEICKDPFAAAVMHGKQTGRCSCCGRELENEESVQLGIGPICRKKWGL